VSREFHPWGKTSPLGENFTPGGKLHPWGKTSPLGENFTPGGKLHPWGSKFAPMGEVKNGPLRAFNVCSFCRNQETLDSRRKIVRSLSLLKFSHVFFGLNFRTKIRTEIRTIFGLANSKNYYFKFYSDQVVVIALKVISYF
jgi:hypothetical protein